jgi:phosphate transport system substrate-binding protein
VKRFSIIVPLAVLVLAGCQSNNTGGNQAAGQGGTGAITGVGSTFVYPVLSAWSADYSKSAGTQVNYQSIGSGGGISQIKAGTVDFGASDKPLDPKELAASGLAQFPVVIGVVPVVNIAGIGAGKLKLTGPLLADIFAGKVKTWNDPTIVKANPGVALPGPASPSSIAPTARAQASTSAI